MLPDAVVLQGVQAVAGRVSQVVNRLGTIQQAQLCQRTILDVVWQEGYTLTIPDLCCFFVGK